MNEHFLPADRPALIWFGGCHNDFSEGSRPTQESHHAGSHNGSSHVLAVDSFASVVLTAEREEVHIVVGDPFFKKLSPDRQTMAEEGEEGGWIKGEGKCSYLFLCLSALIQNNRLKVSTC